MTLPLTLANRLAPLARVPPGQLHVHEIYASVQGESTFAGLPCVFVRLTGCSLRCRWCDSPHAFTQGEPIDPAEVLRRALAFDIPLVELTGGEPLEQPAALPLLTALCDAGRTVLLETSGALDIAGVDRRVHVIMDLKCPDSGEEARNHWANLDHLKPSDQIKFVLASRRDWEWTVEAIRRHRLGERFTCLVSAVFDTLNLEDLANWLVAERLGNVRMQLQMHKYIWHPAARGV